MADCTKAVDFFRTLQRLAASDDGIACEDCGICPAPKPGRAWAPSWELVPPCCVDGDSLLRVAQLIPELQRWADAHPVETWLERLQRALPECDLTYIIRPLCPGSFFAAAPGRHNCPYDGSPQRPDCFSCWRQEATDEL